MFNRTVFFRLLLFFLLLLLLLFRVFILRVLLPYAFRRRASRDHIMSHSIRTERPATRSDTVKITRLVKFSVTTLYGRSSPRTAASRLDHQPPPPCFPDRVYIFRSFSYGDSHYYVHITPFERRPVFAVRTSHVTYAILALWYYSLNSADSNGAAKLKKIAPTDTLNTNSRY